MSNILVTGSNGFIGKWFVKELGKNNTVFGCGRQTVSGNVCNAYYQWDLSCEEEPDPLKEKKIDYIVHAAASLDKNNLADNLVPVNCKGTYAILRTAVAHKVKCVIYISGLPIIGDEHLIPIKETAVLNPPSLYHATKAAGELIIGQLKHYGIRVVSLRVPSPVGPGMPENTILPVFIKHAINNETISVQGKGTRKQNYLDVRDLTEAAKRIMECSDVSGVYNIGSLNIVSNIDLAKKCINVLRSASDIVFTGLEDPSDSVDWTTDDSKLRNVIGDYQKYDIEKTIADIANELKKK